MDQSSPTAAASAARPRVLHVVQPWSEPPLAQLWASHPAAADRCDAAVRACAATIARDSTPDFRRFGHTTLVVGGSAAAARAHALGLDTFDRVAPILGRTSLGAKAFARYALARGPFDIVHLWGESLESLEPWRSSARAILVTDSRRGEVRRLPGAVGSGTDRSCPLPPTTIDAAAARALLVQRDQTRRRLSLNADDVAIALLADPPDAGQVARFTFLVTLLRVSGLRAVAVLDPRGRGASRGLCSRRSGLLEREPILFDGPIEHILSACDIGVLGVGNRFTKSPDPVTWSDASLSRLALDLGVAVTSAAKGLVPEDLDASMTSHSPHPAAMARVIARLCEGAGGLSGVRRRLLERARPDAEGDVADAVHSAWKDALA